MQAKTELIQRTIKGKFIIRPYQPGDDPQIFVSWEKAFNKKLDAEIWHWKYHANPMGFRTMLCLSENGEVAVHYGAQVYKINHNGQEKLALHLTDNFSHPEYRWALGGKTGLFVKTSWVFAKTYLKKSIEDTFKLETSLPAAYFNYGFPGIRHYRLGNKLMFYRSFKEASTFYCTYKSHMRSPLKNSLKTGIATKVINVATPKELNTLWDEIAKKLNPFGVIRDYNFLKWRYFNKPKNNYKFYCLKKRPTNKIKAWLISSTTKNQREKIQLVDFLAKDNTALKQLLQEFLAVNKADIIECWFSNNHPHKKAFLECGFIPEKEPLGIMPCTICDEANVTSNSSDNFIWTIGDADLF